jgi:hypothetical protein
LQKPIIHQTFITKTTKNPLFMNRNNSIPSTPALESGTWNFNLSSWNLEPEIWNFHLSNECATRAQKKRNAPQVFKE